MLNFEKQKKIVWRYGEKVNSTKFAITLLDNFLENGLYRRTDDGRPRDDSSSAVQ